MMFWGNSVHVSVLSYVSCQLFRKIKTISFFQPSKWWHPFRDEFWLSVCWVKAKNSSSASGRALQRKQRNVLRNHIQSALKLETTTLKSCLGTECPSVYHGREGMTVHTRWGRDTVPFVPRGFIYLPSDMWSEACLFHTELTRSSQPLWIFQNVAFVDIAVIAPDSLLFVPVLHY